MNLVEYLDFDAVSPFAKWFAALDSAAAVKITIVLGRLSQGNLSNIKSVGAGVFEYRLDYGPGYRIYFGRDGEDLVILLAGGTKKRQWSDIADAQSRWTDYKRRKRSG